MQGTQLLLSTRLPAGDPVPVPVETPEEVAAGHSEWQTCAAPVGPPLSQ